METLQLSMDWFCWENLQETIDFPIKIMGLSCKFSLTNPLKLGLGDWIKSENTAVFAKRLKRWIDKSC